MMKRRNRSIEYIPPLKRKNTISRIYITPNGRIQPRNASLQYNPFYRKYVSPGTMMRVNNVLTSKPKQQPVFTTEDEEEEYGEEEKDDDRSFLTKANDFLAEYLTIPALLKSGVKIGSDIFNSMKDKAFWLKNYYSSEREREEALKRREEAEKQLQATIKEAEEMEKKRYASLKEAKDKVVVPHIDVTPIQRPLERKDIEVAATETSKGNEEVVSKKPEENEGIELLNQIAQEQVIDDDISKNSMEKRFKRNRLIGIDELLGEHIDFGEHRFKFLSAKDPRRVRKMEWKIGLRVNSLVKKIIKIQQECTSQIPIMKEVEKLKDSNETITLEDWYYKVLLYARALRSTREQTIEGYDQIDSFISRYQKLRNAFIQIYKDIPITSSQRIKDIRDLVITNIRAIDTRLIPLIVAKVVFDPSNFSSFDNIRKSIDQLLKYVIKYPDTFTSVSPYIFAKVVSHPSYFNFIFEKLIE